MALSIRHLRLVAEVAREGTLAGAAKRLFLTQSALSHQLADLERQTGAAVFMRVGRRMVPTVAGRRILRTAGATLDQIEDLTADLKRLRDGKEGELRVTTRCQTAYYWLPEVLSDYRCRHPGIDFRIVPDASEHPVAAVRNGEVDVALDFDVASSETTLSVPLFEDEHVLIVAADSPWAAKQYITPQDFSELDLFVYRNAPGRSFLYERVISPAGIEPRSTSEIRITEGVVALVSAGVGAAAVSKWSVLPHLRQGTIAAVRITEVGLWRTWCAVTLRSAEDLRYVMDFVGLMERAPSWIGRAADRVAKRPMRAS